LRCVEWQAYAAYKKLVAAASTELALDRASSEKWLKIISAFRSPAYQAQLRQQSPRSGRAGLAVNSPHFTGRALDVYVGGDPVSTDDRNRAIQINTRVYQWLVKNAEQFGFYPYFYEPWHWEYCP
jgi:zinc D-Ala-D-Ala carboxypeptidase